MEPHNPLLDDFILGLSHRQPARVCFVPTASADSPACIAEQDVIYVGGGNTANLLVLWRRHGLDVLLRQAWSPGAVLAGVSAGMLCWFKGGVTDSFGALEALNQLQSSGWCISRGTA
jgi:dipeptidase E